MKNDRRNFLKSALFTASAASFASLLKAESADAGRDISSNQYAVHHLFQRDGIGFGNELDKSLDIMRENGLTGLEPNFDSVKMTQSMGKKLQAHGLKMLTGYCGINLHDQSVAQSEIDRVFAIAESAAPFGTKMIVFNPAVKKGKSDSELALQSENMNKLGAKLKTLGISLAFHYHTSELEFGGREFHHALCGTDPANMTLCFEMHWSYRGCGNSALAVYDHLKLYGNRVSCIHLRQSVNNVWSETFSDGDIDCRHLAASFAAIGKKPVLILEQVPENGTPKTLSTGEVLRASVDYTRKIFDEQQIVQALNDPEFKKIHDFLTRENPIEMELNVK
jgi:inosose dehydratase